MNLTLGSAWVSHLATARNTSRHAISSSYPASSIQSRYDVREQIENVGQRFIRDYLPDDHRQFYPQLPMLLVGSIDHSGRPWASVLVGRPGFINSPDPRTLEVHAKPLFGDPLNENLTQGVQLGMLGIEYSTRRRNRLNGEASLIDESYFRISVGQSFGNCPQYIQARNFEFVSGVEYSVPLRRSRADRKCRATLYP